MTPKLRTAEAEERPAPGPVRPRHVADWPSLAYHLVVPATLPADAPILVAVHGISRNADDYVRLFSAAAGTHGAILVVPVFSRDRFADYQRLGASGRGLRPDRALDAVLAEVRRSVPGAGPRLLLFGHSGGGQFVHRYVMAQPERVTRYVVSAAGWYTLPDPNRAFPEGIGPTPLLPDLALDPRGFLRVPGCVMVGMRDQRRSRTLKADAELDREQGFTRLERGRRWVARMNAAAGSLGLPPPLAFRELPDAGHLFGSMVRNGGLVEASVDYLLGRRDPQLTDGRASVTA